MKTKRIGTVAIAVVLATMAVGAGRLYRPKVQSRAPAERDAHAEPAHKEHAGDAHGEHGPKERAGDAHGEREHKEPAGDAQAEHAHAADLAMSPEQILAARCEHEVPTYQCAECRYEVGVVKVGEALTKAQPGKKDPLIRAVEVAMGEITATVGLTGEVQLNENTAAHISPRISGIIQSVSADLGADVKKGDVLFEIDSVALGQAVSAHGKSRAMAALAKRSFEREKALFERKVASERAMIEAQMTYEEHQAELAAAEQTLRVLGVDPEAITAPQGASTRSRIGRLAVRAPFDGTIIEKHAVIGELAEPGKDVFLVADLASVWVWANVYGHDLGPLVDRRRRGPIAVSVSVHAYPDRVFRGMLDYVGATMDESTRTVKVRVSADNTERLLRPGMFCEISVPLASNEQALVIPKAALLSDEGRDFVFRQLEADYYVRRAVKKGRETDGHVEILEGLKPGEVIVTGGAFLLKSDVLRAKMGAGCAH